MKSKFFNFPLIITSLFGYLEWGGNNQIFLLKTELDILSKIFINLLSVLHPQILLPFASQILLMTTLFQKNPNKILTYISIIGLGLLLGFMFVIGLMDINYKIIISTITFIFFGVVTIHHHRKNRIIN